MVLVYKASGTESNLDDLSPLSAIIFKDSNYNKDTTHLMEGSNITRTVGNLENGDWYMWTVVPAHEAVNKGAYPGTFVKRVENVTLIDGQNLENPYIDLRGYFLCKWNQNQGCERNNTS